MLLSFHSIVHYKFDKFLCYYGLATNVIKGYQTTAPSICQDKIYFVQDKIKIVLDKIIFVLDKKICP